MKTSVPYWKTETTKKEGYLKIKDMANLRQSSDLSAVITIRGVLASFVKGSSINITDIALFKELSAKSPSFDWMLWKMELQEQSHKLKVLSFGVVCILSMNVNKPNFEVQKTKFSAFSPFYRM